MGKIVPQGKLRQQICRYAGIIDRALRRIFYPVQLCKRGKAEIFYFIPVNGSGDREGVQPSVVKQNPAFLAPGIKKSVVELTIMPDKEIVSDKFFEFFEPGLSLRRVLQILLPDPRQLRGLLGKRAGKRQTS